jgi:hypothetical protein
MAEPARYVPCAPLPMSAARAAPALIREARRRRVARRAPLTVSGERGDGGSRAAHCQR